jgi:TonB-dependent SusC/RagA subfamily outer membrane receptor
MNSISDKKIERQCFAIKIFRVMRLCLLFLALSLTQVFASVSYSQSVSVSLQMKNVSIEEVLNQIEEETEFRFLYNKKMVNVEREVNVSANNKNIVEILDNLFKNAGISYSISGRQIVLNKREATEAIQQTRKVIGVVFDSQGEPVIGANVVEKGTTNGTITDVDGAFTLDVSANAVLKVSYIGYADQEVAVNNKNSLEVRLAENTELIDEVVVVGYGTQKKATVTGSVAQISGEVVKQSPAANLSNSIAGRIPGVVANNRSGEPGSDASEIYIRGKGTLGNNSPLYVIDGVANRGGIDRLNPNDIESISVLKDASASIYGAQAANGVILVTTKRGTDSKPVISYDGNFSVSQNTRTPHLMDAYQYMVYDDEANKYLGRDQIWANIKGGYLEGSIKRNILFP